MLYIFCKCPGAMLPQCKLYITELLPEPKPLIVKGFSTLFF